MYDFLLKLFKVDINNRKSVGYFEGTISIIVNILITVIKLAYALFIGSISLLADAIHSLSDVVSSIIVIFSFKFSTKEPDINHPFGHGRIENIASIIVATLLMVVATEFAINSVKKIISPATIHIDAFGFAIIIFTVFIKEFLSRLSIYLGKKINSQSLIAEGYHHRSDALSTIIVIVGFIGNNLGIYYADGVAGFFVSLFIFHTAYDLIKDSSQVLIGSSPDKKILEDIKKIVKKYEGIIGFHDIVVHDFGTIFNISLHMEVPNTMDIVEAHELADKVEKEIAKKYKGHIVVHIDPINTSHPLYNKVKEIIEKNIVPKYPCFETVHDIRIVGSEKYFNVVFDVNLQNYTNHKKIIKEAQEIIKSKLGANDVSINMELPLQT